MTLWNNFTFYVSLTEARLTDWRQTLVVPSSWHLCVWSSGKSHQWGLKTKYLSHLTHRNGKVVRLTALFSLETLELVFNVSSEYQGCHHGRNFVKMTTFPFLCRESCSIWFYALIPEKNGRYFADNGLVQNGWQASPWTNDDSLLMHICVTKPQYAKTWLHQISISVEAAHRIISRSFASIAEDLCFKYTRRPEKDTTKSQPRCLWNLKWMSRKSQQ